MRKILFILLFLPIFFFAQNSSVRIFPYYFDANPVIYPFDSWRIGWLPGFGLTIGYDQMLSDDESIEVNLKPTIHILDGDQDLFSIKGTFGYKRFFHNNFYTSNGLELNYKKSFVSYYANGDGYNLTYLTFGPHSSIGKRINLSNLFFLDVGFGLSFEYLFYYYPKDVPKTYDIELNKFHYFAPILIFNIGYITMY